MPPEAAHRHPEGPRDVPDVPGPATLEAYGRILPQHPECGAGEGVHRAMCGGIRHHVVEEHIMSLEGRLLVKTTWTQPQYV